MRSLARFAALLALMAIPGGEAAAQIGPEDDATADSILTARAPYPLAPWSRVYLGTDEVPFGPLRPRDDLERLLSASDSAAYHYRVFESRYRWEWRLRSASILLIVPAILVDDGGWSTGISVGALGLFLGAFIPQHQGRRAFDRAVFRHNRRLEHP